MFLGVACLGAGVSAGINVVEARMASATITVLIALLIAYFFLFNPSFARLAEKNKTWRLIRNQGIVPAQIFAIICGPFLIGELPAPQIQWGLTPLSFGFVLEHFTIFGIGFPDITFFLRAIPMAVQCFACVMAACTIFCFEYILV